jgi:hypothetical protein
MSTVISIASTSANQSNDFTVRGFMRAGGDHAHLTAPGIAGVEVATVQKKNAAGTYNDYYVASVLQTISIDSTGVVIDAAGVYRVDKGVTSASVAIEVSTPDSP